jgi:hypothetical protein
MSERWTSSWPPDFAGLLRCVSVLSLDPLGRSSAWPPWRNSNRGSRNAERIRARFGQRSSRIARRAALISTLKAFRCSTIAAEFRPVFQAFALPLGGPAACPCDGAAFLAAGGGYLPHFSLPLPSRRFTPPWLTIPQPARRGCAGPRSAADPGCAGAKVRRPTPSRGGHLVRSAKHDLPIGVSNAADLASR